MIVCICLLGGACQEVRGAKPYYKIAFLTTKKADVLPAAQPQWLGRGDRGLQAPVRLTHQCSTFTGIILVFSQNLITEQWYWYVVCESGIGILNTASSSSAPVTDGESHRPQPAMYVRLQHAGGVGGGGGTHGAFSATMSTEISAAIFLMGCACYAQASAHPHARQDPASAPGRGRSERRTHPLRDYRPRPLH